MKEIKIISRVAKKLKTLNRATNIKKIKLQKLRTQDLAERALIDHYKEYKYAKDVVESFDESTFRIVKRFKKPLPIIYQYGSDTL